MEYLKATNIPLEDLEVSVLKRVAEDLLQTKWGTDTEINEDFGNKIKCLTKLISDNADNSAIKEFLNSVDLLEKVCLPCFLELQETMSHEKLLHSVCELIVTVLGIIQKLNSEFAVKHIHFLTEEYAFRMAKLQSDAREECKGDKVPSVANIIELLSYMLDGNILNNFQVDTLFYVLLEILQTEEKINLLPKILTKLIPKILQNYQDGNGRLKLLFEFGTQGFVPAGDLNSEQNGTRSQSDYFILCSIADYILPSSGPPPPYVLAGIDFWYAVNRGLYHSDSLTRKRAMYLLKRAFEIYQNTDDDIQCQDQMGSCPLFGGERKHKQQLSLIWEDFILVIETLEETQVHVIKPIMPRVESLVKATYKREDGFPLLHTLWLVPIFHLTQQHDWISIKRWGMETLLNIDPSQCPMLEQGLDKFISGPFVDMLRESTLYARQPDASLGSAPAIATKLVTFLNAVQGEWERLKKNGDSGVQNLFKNLLSSITTGNWGAVPLLFLIQAIASLPVCDLRDAECLKNIRDILVTTTRTFDVYFRGALQCFLARSVIKHINLDKCQPSDVANTICELKRRESFHRGGSVWKYYADWLKGLPIATGVWSRHEILQFIKLLIDDCLSVKDGEHTTLDTTVFKRSARFLALLVDADILPTNSSDPSQDSVYSLLCPVLNTVNSVNSHPYMPALKVDKAVLLFVSLWTEVKPVNKAYDVEDGLFECLVDISCSCAEELLEYVRRKLNMELEETDCCSAVTLYSTAIHTVLTNVSFSKVPQLREQVKRLTEETGNKLVGENDKGSLQPQLQRYLAVSLLATVGQVLFTHERLHDELELQQVFVDVVMQMTLVYDFGKPDEKYGESRLSGWGVIVGQYLYRQWACILVILENKGTAYLAQRHPLHSLHQMCLDTLSIVSGQSVVPVLKCLSRILPELIEDTEEVISTFDILWRKVKEELRSSSFSEVLNVFVNTVFQPVFLKCDEQSDIWEAVNKYFKALSEVSELRIGIINPVATAVCEFLCKENHTNLSHGYKWLDILVHLIMFGPIRSKHRKYCNNASAYFESLGKNLDTNQLVQSLRKEDSMVRVTVLNFLSKLDMTNSNHQECASALMKLLMVKFQELLRAKVYRNMENSLSHRQKYRIVSAILILDASVQKSDIPEISKFLTDTLMSENQPSVRYAIEWLAMRAMMRYPELQELLWQHLETSSHKRPSFVCSLMSIASHVGMMLENQELQEQYFLKVIPALLPWIMTHHFNTRVYAQAAMVKVWRYLGQKGLTRVTEKYEVLEKCVDVHFTGSQTSANTKKLLESFFFFVFHPMQDFSIETICHTLPWLMEISDEEWLSPDDFPDVGKDKTLLSLYNERDHLKTCTPGGYRLRVSHVDESGDTLSGDVQKKIIPWRNMLPQDEDEETDGKKKHKPGGLIVVASLIDKIPNLGGLCRTSEIFGVSEYVLGNMKYVADKLFQSLSVSAHNWIPIKEVPPHLLQKYLLEMKHEGYTLVGVEQTAGSQQLTNYTFPVKTLLVLGNEKEGIPVNIIQLLDVCVEIPQQGLTRSLNVHVSGAVLIWEYARQQLVIADRDCKT